MITSIRSSLLLCLVGALAAEDVDVVTLTDGSILIGVYDQNAHTIALRGDASGTATIDPATVASTTRKRRDGAAPTMPGDWPSDTPETAALRKTIAEDQQKVDDLGGWVAIVQRNLAKARAAVEETENQRKDASDKLEMEKAVNGVTTRPTEQRLADAQAAATKAADAVPPLETELRTSQAKLELARKTLARDQERLDAPPPPKPDKKK